jgi:hypothetical protein
MRSFPRLIDASSHLPEHLGKEGISAEVARQEEMPSCLGAILSAGEGSA